MAERQVTARLDLKTSGKQDLQALQTAIENFGEEGVRGAQDIVDGFERVDKASGKVIGAFDKGRIASEKSVGEMIVNFQNLDKSIKQTFGSLENAPKEVQEAFAHVSSNVEQARGRFVQTQNALKDVNAELAISKGQWTGLGNAIEQSLGQYGQIVAGLGVMTAALKEGWNMGMKFGEMIGTNTEAYKLFTEDMKQSGAVVQSAMNDVIANVINLGTQLVTLQANSSDFSDFTASMKGDLATLAASLAFGGEAAKGMSAAVEAGIPILELSGARERELIEIGNQRTAMLAAGREGQALWNKAIEEAGGDLDKLKAALIEAQPSVQALAKAKSEAKTETVQYKDAIGDLINNVARLQQEWIKAEGNRQKLTTAEQQALDLIVKQQPVVDGNTEALAEQYKVLSTLLPQGELHSQQIAITAKGLAELLAAQDGLTKAQREEHEELIKKIKQYADLTKEEQAAIVSKVGLKAAMNQTEEATGKVVAVMENGKTVIKQMADEADGAAERLNRTTAATIKLTAAMDEMTKKALEARGVLVEVQVAAEKLAGES